MLLGGDSVWVWSGEVAVLLGSLAFVVLFVPIVAWQYRRYGSLNWRRLAGAGAVSLYLTALVTYTWLPLPDRSQPCRVDGPQLEPLAFVPDIRSLAAEVGWSATLTSTTFLQVAFNVLLFVPWGVGVRGYLGRSVAMATLSGAAVSLFIEVSQGTGLWFIYPCPYRLADVDDLLTNTLGAFLGAVLAPLLLWWMPSRAQLQAKRLMPRPVKVWRRWLAMLIEFAALFLVGLIATVLLRVALLVLDGELTALALERTEQAGILLGWLVTFVVPALAGLGSLGMRATWLVPVWPEGTRGLGPRRLLRACIVSGPWVAALLVADPALQAAAWAVALAAVASVPVTRGRRGLTCALAGAELRDARADLPTPAV